MLLYGESPALNYIENNLKRLKLGDLAENKSDKTLVFLFSYGIVLP